LEPAETTVTKQLLAKHVPTAAKYITAAMDIYETTKKLLGTVFSIQREDVGYHGRKMNILFPKKAENVPQDYVLALIFYSLYLQQTK
jgi:hypothetical protein